MSKRIDLRAYRESIATRLAAAQTGEGTSALLGFESGGRNWLIDLPAAGEVLPLPELSALPLTRDWFAGLASVHGELRAVVDFSVFRGAAATPRDGNARLLCVGTQRGNNLALLVGRVHGLKRPDALTAIAATATDDAHPWCGGAFADDHGQHWTRLDSGRLLTDPAILDAALPDTDSR